MAVTYKLDFEPQQRSFAVRCPLSTQTSSSAPQHTRQKHIYLPWLEELRSTLLKTNWANEWELNSHNDFVVTSTQVEYQSPLPIPEHLTGIIWIAELGHTQWTFKVEIYSDSQLSSQHPTHSTRHPVPDLRYPISIEPLLQSPHTLIAKITQVGFQQNPITQRSIPIPEEFLHHYWESQWSL